MAAREWVYDGLGLVRAYVTRCEEVEREPDGDLLERMHAVLLAAGVIEGGE